jgi:hypothetical protein
MIKKIIIAFLIATIVSCNVPRGGHAQALIKVINVIHHDDLATSFQGEFRIPLPPPLVGVVNAPDIMASYQGLYNIIGLDTIGLTYYAVFRSDAFKLPLFKRDSNDLTTNIPNMPEDFYDRLISSYQYFQTQLNNFSLMPSDAIIGRKWNGTTWEY